MHTHTNLRYEVRTDTDTNDNTARINIMPVKTKHRTRKSGTIVCSWWFVSVYVGNPRRKKKQITGYNRKRSVTLIIPLIHTGEIKVPNGVERFVQACSMFPQWWWKEHKRPYHDLKRRLNSTCIYPFWSHPIHSGCMCVTCIHITQYTYIRRIRQVVMMTAITMMIIKGTERPKLKQFPN